MDESLTRQEIGDILITLLPIKPMRLLFRFDWKTDERYQVIQSIFEKKTVPRAGQVEFSSDSSDEEYLSYAMAFIALVEYGSPTQVDLNGNFMFVQPEVSVTLSWKEYQQVRQGNLTFQLLNRLAGAVAYTSNFEYADYVLGGGDWEPENYYYSLD